MRQLLPFSYRFTVLRPGPRGMAGLIIALFIILATTYSIVTPIFESPDELWHYPFVWHLARTAKLPVQDPANPGLWAQEGSQPPLYYALAALLTAAIPTGDLPALIYRNPHAGIGLVSPDGNANIVVHTPRESWPWQGAVLAIHAARFLSVLLGAGTVAATAALGRVVWPNRPAPALLAAGFVAFNPMFIFISGSVNNDNLVTLLASLVLWRLAVTVTGNSPIPARQFALLGLLAGLAALAKVSGLGLLGLTGLTLLWQGIRWRSWRTAVAGNGLAVLVAGAVAGWWYTRNLTLYGDWSGVQNMVAMMGPRPVPPTASQLVTEIPGLFRSFWGLFGYFSVPMPAPLYWLFNLILAAGLAGWPAAFFAGRGRWVSPNMGRVGPVLVVWIALMLAGLIRWTLRTPATQGRLLFPALAALAVLWAAGWVAIAPRRGQALPVLAMLAVALWVPAGVIAPAYARPAPVDSLPKSARPLNATYGDSIQLLGYTAPPAAVYPGDSLPVTLFWQSTRPVGRDYSVFIHLLDENEVVIAQRNVFHGPGVYPTGQWVAGQAFADTYVLRLPRTTYAPAQAQFEVGLYDHTTGIRLPVSTGGTALRFGSVAVQPRPGPWPNPQRLDFENHITLAGYSLNPRRVTAGEPVTVTLYWQSRGRPPENYKVFVHLVGPDGNRPAQHDSEPRQGAAPTSTWIPGQTVIDEHRLIPPPTTPAGVYRLVAGLYREDTGQRLRLLRNAGEPVQADSIDLAGIRITAQPEN